MIQHIRASYKQFCNFQIRGSKIKDQKFIFIAQSLNLSQSNRSMDEPHSFENTIQLQNHYVSNHILQPFSQQNLIRIEEDPHRPDDNNQKSRSKKYDYLNKYTQHQLGRIYNIQPSAVSNVFERVSRWDRNERRREAENSTANNYEVSKDIKEILPKSKPKSKSFERQSIQSHRKSNNSPAAHFAYLQAYQNNIPPTKDEFFQQISHPQKIMNRQQINNGEQQKQLARFGNTVKISEQKQISKIMRKIPNLANGLSAEIIYQNQLYKNQIAQYRSIVSKLEFQLNCTRQQRGRIEQSFLEEKICYENMIKSLTDEVLVLRGFKQRYEILNSQMIILNNQILSLQRQKQNKDPNPISYQDFSVRSPRNRDISRGKIRKVEFKPQQVQKFIIDKIQGLMNTNCCKNTNIAYQLSNSSQQAIDKLAKLMSKNKKYEDFILNIKQMHRKIEKKQILADNGKQAKQELPTKQLWKWLKSLGSNYSYMIEIKPLIAKKIGFSQEEGGEKTFRELIEKILISF